ncbi:MAG: response regulator [Gammaproteobacteria bacterium]|nr:response regulator [Gammaproteobacteria bacterium]
MAAKIQILLADHELMLRESVAAYLEDSGYIVHCVDDGEAALEFYTNTPPDIIITELDLPKLSGLELMKKVRLVDQDMPLIVCTAVSNEHDIIHALRLGIYEYIIKPINDLSLIDQALQKALEKKRLKIENEKIRQTLLEDQEAGKSVQEKILPDSLYQKGDIKIEHHVEPMIYLSGDFIDYFELDDDRFVFYLADVSGHGAAAAFVTVLIKMFIRELAAKYRSDGDERIIVPHLMVRSLAQEIYSEKLGKYCTMLYFVYNKRLGELHYCVAGHYPNPILIQNNQPKVLPGRGFPVGISASMSYKTEIIEPQSPFRVVLFSDGIFEILTGDFENKDHRLLELLGQSDYSFESINKVFKITTTPNRLDDIATLIFSQGFTS